MRCKRLLSLTLAVCMTLGSSVLLPQNLFVESTGVTANADSDYLIPQFETKTNGAKSSNKSANYYSTYASTVKSCIYEDSDNNLWRAEFIDSKIVIEKYSQGAKKLIKTFSVNPELPIYGGVFFGKDYNYVVSGRKNPDYDDNIEVLRVTKYTKQWEKVDHASVFGANTLEPFHAGSCRMTEASGKLYVDTCHTMYKSDDGLNHQANMCFVIDETQMTVINSHYEVWNLSIGYVSHSFNQFIKTDGEKIYRIDHGDAHPRGIPIIVNNVDGSIRNVNYTIPVTFEGAIGQNSTGASIGGLEVSSDTILFPYNQEPDSSSSFRNILINVTSKSLEKSYQKNITNYDESSNVTCSTPQIVKVNNDMYVVLWEETNKTTSEKTVRLVSVDRNGDKISNIVAIEANLSDCQPILCSDGCIRWYVTSDSSPFFYAIQPYDINSLHIHKADWKVIKKETCTTDGQQTGKCSICGKTITKTIKATGHDWDSWPTISWDGGDTAKGVFTCRNDSSHTTSVKATIVSTSIISPATCTSVGLKRGTFRISFGNYTYTSGGFADIPKTAHKWSDWTITKKATCTATGTKNHTCSVCGTTETQTITKLGHNYKSTIVNPTCTAKGYALHKCVRCGDSYKDTYKAANGHSWSAWKTTKQATCTTEGLKTRTCSVCKKTEKQTIAATGHSWSAWKTTKQATCTTEGLKTRTCSVCKKTEKQTIAATGHSWSAWKTTKQATCTTAGSKTRTCSVCKMTESVTIKATGHKWSAWKTTKAASPTSTGTQTRACSICKKTETKTLSKTSIRLSGYDRYDTSFAIADQLRKINGNKKFKSIIIASGSDYADALSSAYLAKIKDAPIILTHPSFTDKVIEYVKKNSESSAQIYIIGGAAAVNKDTEKKLKKSFKNVKRLWGQDRFETNLEVLKQANVKGQELLVGNGLGYADALSASAVGRPMMLVSGKTLTAKQKAFLKQAEVKSATLLGESDVVSSQIEKQFKQLVGNIDRQGGRDRFETSVLIAKKYFKNPKTISLAYGLNYPDGLCGAPLAMKYGCPLLLTINQQPENAKAYAKQIGATSAVTFGGDDLISDKTIKTILSK